MKDQLGNEKWTRAFDALIRSLTLREHPFCLHLHFEDGRGNIRILLKERFQSVEGHLTSLVQSQLPGFVLTKSHESVLSSLSFTTFVRQIVGNPQLIGDDITTRVSEFFEHSRATGNYVALFQPFKPSRVKRSLLNREYRKLSGRAMRSEMRRGIGRTDTTDQTLDFIESERLERTGRELERLAGKYALKSYLYLLVHAESEELAEQGSNWGTNPEYRTRIFVCLPCVPNPPAAPPN